MYGEHITEIAEYWLLYGALLDDGGFTSMEHYKSFVNLPLWNR